MSHLLVYQIDSGMMRASNTRVTFVTCILGVFLNLFQVQDSIS